MTARRLFLMTLGLLFVTSGFPTAAEERHMMAPRVPADKLAEARALTSPLPNSPEIVEKGKTLYNGKGTCFNCHGASGRGDGAAARGLDPSPRDFHHHGFWRHRAEGELFWVIKHGIAGTAMIPFGGQLTDEEIWAVIQYERSFAGGHRGPRGAKGRMGPREEGCCTGQ
jgi:mono/diheme cytochrome c family protein